MDLFVVTLEDRHIENHLEIYSSEELAVERAKELAEEYREIYQYHENDPEIERLWIYYKNTNSEGDCVHVQKLKLNEKRNQ